MDEISRTNSDNELSNMSSALESCPASAAWSQVCRAGRRIAILGPGRTAIGSRDQPGVNQLEGDVPSSRIEQETSTIPESARSTPVPRPVAGTIPSSQPSGPDFGADRNGSSPYSATPTPSMDREDSMDIILDHPNLASLTTVLNGQWEMYNMMQNIVGREEMIRLSLNWNAREDLAPERTLPTTKSGSEPEPTSGTSHSRSIPVFNHNTRDSTSTTSAPPRRQTWDNSIYHTPPSFLEHSVPARSVPGADELRLRTSTPLSPSRKLERIREEQEKTPERDARPAQDGTVLHARRGVMDVFDALARSEPLDILIKLKTPLQPRVEQLTATYSRQPIRRVSPRKFTQEYQQRIDNDNPFLIEDKLHILFDNFFSQLAGTLESVPSNLLKSCVDNLSFTINNTL
ncbi:hypothetical protein KEM48_013739 [Puccinia striiformis f. sp. tritici PST-130]|nr:hypothetical protein KEM48_013739 [Puccinia striiformis f. sp. tritici PST-130]